MFFLTTGRSPRWSSPWGDPDPVSVLNESVLDRLRARGEDPVVLDHLVRVLAHDGRGPEDL